MASLFPVDVFHGFGPTTVVPFDFSRELGRVKSGKEKGLRQYVRTSAPRLPGVYGMLNRVGELIYVGKAKHLRNRLMSYFRKGRDRKAGRILKHTRTLVWETVPDEFAALVRELELIRRHLPRFNVQGRPGRMRYAYLCVGRAPAPYAFVTRRPTGKEMVVYGPFTSAGRVSDSVRRLNDWYRLRDCAQTVRMHFRDELELFPIERPAGCLRYDIGTCSGPCAGGCGRRGYSGQVRRAREFLDGNDQAPLIDLERRMAEASAALQFEHAAAIRDRRQSLQWLSDRLAWLRNARRENTFIYPITGTHDRVVWYLVFRGRVRSALFAPRNPEECRAVGERLDDVYAVDSGPVIPIGQFDHVLLTSAWFRKFPDEKSRLLSVDEALRICRDGAVRRAS